ncbi:MAG: hypothetical protein KDJ25_06695 [Rhodoblastus sp.]|nr:hypothetical protein [Rhodoblastus sp.]
MKSATTLAILLAGLLAAVGDLSKYAPIVCHVYNFSGCPVAFSKISVNLNHGNAKLNHEYELRDIRYGPNDVGTHWFKFNLYKMTSLISADVEYAGANKIPWQDRIHQLPLDGKVLEFAFSDFDNHIGMFRYRIK